MQSCCLPFTVFVFREMGRNRPGLESKGRGYGNCFITGAVRFFAGNGKLFDILEIRDFRNGIYTRFASPRVRQRRGRWSPPSVVPAGSRPEATGAFNPSWDSPAASGHGFSHPLCSLLLKKKDLAEPAKSLGFAWWPLPELNRGHEDFQSSALPSELKGHLVQRLANTLAFERRCIRSSFVVPLMPIEECRIGCRGYPRERISSGSGAQVRRTLPVRLHLRALLARRIDALDASGYLRDATRRNGGL